MIPETRDILELLFAILELIFWIVGALFLAYAEYILLLRLIRKMAEVFREIRLICEMAKMLREIGEEREAEIAEERRAMLLFFAPDAEEAVAPEIAALRELVMQMLDHPVISSLLVRDPTSAYARAMQNIVLSITCPINQEVVRNPIMPIVRMDRDSIGFGTVLPIFERWALLANEIRLHRTGLPLTHPLIGQPYVTTMPADAEFRDRATELLASADAQRGRSLPNVRR